MEEGYTQNLDLTGMLVVVTCQGGISDPSPLCKRRSMSVVSIGTASEVWNIPGITAACSLAASLGASAMTTAYPLDTGMSLRMHLQELTYWLRCQST